MYVSFVRYFGIFVKSLWCKLPVFADCFIMSTLRFPHFGHSFPKRLFRYLQDARQNLLDLVDLPDGCECFLDGYSGLTFNKLLSYLTFMYNTTPHSVTGIEPYTLMFGRRPQIPLDHLISNLPNDYSVDYVSNQSTFLKRVYDIVKQRLEKAASTRKQCYDSKAHLPSLDIGSRVLLQKTGFKDRHKLEDHYNSDPYVVLRRNDSGELYEIRPALGGQSRWVNAKMIIPDPRGISDICDDSDFDSIPLIELPESSDSEASDSESDEFDMPYLYSTQTVDPPVEIEPIIEPIDEQPIPVPRPSPRRSSRSTKGQHSNPYAQPKSVLAIEYHPLN